MSRRITLSLFIVLGIPLQIAVLSAIADQFPRFGLAPAMSVFISPLIVVAFGDLAYLGQPRTSRLRSRQGFLLFLLLLLSAIGIVSLKLINVFNQLEMVLAVISVITITLILGIPVIRHVISIFVLIILGGLLFQSGVFFPIPPERGFIVGSCISIWLCALVVSIAEAHSQYNAVERLGRSLNNEAFPSFEDDTKADQETATSSVLEALDSLLSNQRFGYTWRTLLGRANVRLTVAEYAALHIVSAFGFFTSGYFVLFGGDKFASIIAGIIGFYVPTLWIQYLAGSRLIRFYNQLPDTIIYLSNSVGQGFNILQAMRGLSNTAMQPTAEEFRRVVAEQTMGMETENALDHLLDRMPLRDLAMALRSMRIQSRRGGNIARLLGVAHHMVIARTTLFFYIGQYKRWKARLPFIILCCMVLIQWSLFPSYWRGILESQQGSFVIVMVYGLFVITLLIIGHSRRRLRGIQRGIGFAAIADLEVFIEMVGGGALLLLLGGWGVPLVGVILLGLLLVQVVMGISFLGLFFSIALMVVLLLAEPQFFASLSSGLFGEISLPSFLSWITTQLSTEVAVSPTTNATMNSSNQLSPSFVGYVMLWLLFIVGGLIYVSLREERGRDSVQERLAQYGERNLPGSLEEVELSMSFRDRVLLPIFTWIGRGGAWFTPQVQFQNAQYLLDRAGLSSSLISFFLLRIMSLLLGFISAAYLGRVLFSQMPETISLVMLCGIISGFFLPTQLVRLRMRRRYRKISEELPEVLTLLSMYLSAGVSLDWSMTGIFEDMEGIVALGFGRVSREVSLGKPRRDALNDMAQRLNHPDLTRLIAALLVNDALGERELPRIVQEMTDEVRTRWTNNVQANMTNYGEIIDNVWQIGLIVTLVIWLIAPFVVQHLE